MSPHGKYRSTSPLSDGTSNDSISSRSSFLKSVCFPPIQGRRSHPHPSTQSESLPSKLSSPNSSTPLSSVEEEAAFNPSLATKAAINPSAKTKHKPKNHPSAKHAKLRGERSRLDLDWSFRNLYLSGPDHGRKTIGGGSASVAACVLM